MYRSAFEHSFLGALPSSSYIIAGIFVLMIVITPVCVFEFIRKRRMKSFIQVQSLTFTKSGVLHSISSRQMRTPMQSTCRLFSHSKEQPTHSES